MQKAKSRKLNLRTETVRELTPKTLENVAGGKSSANITWCSTWGEDSGCFNTNSNCDHLCGA
jgi:hypothetical protein